MQYDKKFYQRILCLEESVFNIHSIVYTYTHTQTHCVKQLCCLRHLISSVQAVEQQT